MFHLWWVWATGGPDSRCVCVAVPLVPRWCACPNQLCVREDSGCQVEGADLMAAREISSTAVPREGGREAGREGGREGGRKGGMTADSSRYTLSSCCLQRYRVMEVARTSPLVNITVECSKLVN